ncbi:sulfotransferase domain-containing protein [Nostoc punctiforme UO1]|uniref:tetratricopeptide repeat-containing sulfotransferase family protein n=1 Tax=Nostoc punctiforme TaxID=272131 RepID=UPI0030A69725
MINHLEKLSIYYQKALLIKPDNAIVHSKLGNLYEAQMNFEEATYHYIKSIEFDPSYFHNYWKLKYSLLQLNRWEQEIESNLLEQGITTLSQAIESQPNFPFAQVLLGNLLTQQGKIEEAIACYQNASYKQINLSYPELVKNHWNPHQKTQPDFLIPGFIKSGTSSLYNYLISHPQILPAVDNGLCFFTDFFEQELDWYLAHFPSIPASMNYITGETTPIYIYFPSITKKIFHLFPNIKLVILLRNPVDRAISSYFHQHKINCGYKLIQDNIDNILEKMPSLLDKLHTFVWLEPSMIKKYRSPSRQDVFSYHLMNSLYIYYLKEWLNVFPREQFLFVKSEDLFSNPSVTMKKVFSFLNLPDYPLAEYPNYNPGSYNPISDDLRQTLAEFFRPHNQKLEEYLGMKFNWDE